MSLPAPTRKVPPMGITLPARCALSTAPARRRAPETAPSSLCPSRPAYRGSYPQAPPFPKAARRRSAPALSCRGGAGSAPQKARRGPPPMTMQSHICSMLCTILHSALACMRGMAPCVFFSIPAFHPKGKGGRKLCGHAVPAQRCLHTGDTLAARETCGTSGAGLFGKKDRRPGRRRGPVKSFCFNETTTPG